jgi:hypothetical protein
MVERSDAAILEGARLHVSQPHGWGISMSKSGEFQMSVNTSVAVQYRPVGEVIEAVVAGG